MLRILQKYALVEIAKVFVLALLAITFMMTLGISYQTLQRGGAKFTMVLRALPFISPLALSFTFPIAILLATTLVYGRMSADNEITALRAGGFHLMTIIWPAVLVGLLLSLCALGINSYLIPRCHYKLQKMVKEELPALLEASLRQKRIEFDDTIMSFRDYDISNWTIKDVSIYQLNKGQPEKEFSAAAARISVDKNQKQITFRLTDVTLTIYGEDAREAETIKAREYTIWRDLASFVRVDKDYDDMGTGELMEEISVSSSKEIPEIRTEIQRRYSMSLACLAFVFVGAPLGIFLKKGHTLSAFALSCLPVFLVYYPLLMVGKSLGTEGRLNPIIAMWSSNLFMAAIGGVLFIRLFKR